MKPQSTLVVLAGPIVAAIVLVAGSGIYSVTHADDQHQQERAILEDNLRVSWRAANYWAFEADRWHRRYENLKQSQQKQSTCNSGDRRRWRLFGWWGRRRC